MRCNRLFLTALCLVLFPTVMLAQLKQDNKVNFARALTKPQVNNIIGLLGLNPDNFSMTHSYSLSFGSFGGNSYNQGLYLNTMRYKFSDPLTLHLQIGVQHQPFGNKFGGSQFGNEVFISSAGMEYKPSDNFKLQLEYSRRPASYYYMQSPFNDPITRNRDYFDNKEEEKENENE